MAIESIKVHFGPQGLEDLRKDLGLDASANVEKLIASVLEARVHDIRANSSTPVGALTGGSNAAAVVTAEKGA